MKYGTQRILVAVGVVAMLGSACARSENHSYGPENTSARGGGPRGLSDAEIGAITSAADLGEIRQAQLALNRSDNPDVRSFAQQMIQQHSDSLQRGNDLLGRLHLTPLEDRTSSDLQFQSAQTMQNLQTLRGADFDRNYINDQVRAHEHVLNLFDANLVPSAHNAELRNMLNEGRSMVQMHLERARQIQANLNNVGGGAMPQGAPE